MDQSQPIVWVGPESVGAERDWFPAELGTWRDRPVIRFSAPHARGATAFEIHLPCETFASIAEKMMKTNPDMAVRAFGRALSMGLPSADSKPLG